MTNTKYAFKDLKENMARALSRDLDISTKVAIEMSNYLKGRTTENAKEILRNVLNKTAAIPFKRFTDGVGHRKGAKIGSGRYPVKGSQKFLMIIESAEANAQAKGLSSDLKIIHLCAQKGTNQFRSGRQRRRAFKRTHLEIVVEEMDKPKQKAVGKTQTKDAKPKAASGPQKTEVKPAEAKKEVPKKEAAKPVPKEEEKPAEIKKEPIKKAEVKKEEKPNVEPKKEEQKSESKKEVKKEKPAADSQTTDKPEVEK